MTLPSQPAAPGQTIARSHAPVTARVNVEPPVLNGMAATEATWIAVLSVAGYGFVGLLVILTTGVWQIGLALPTFGTAFTLWSASLRLAKLKRGRPDYYYEHAIQRWMATRGLSRERFLTRTGFWSVGCVLPFGFASPFRYRDPGAAADMPQPTDESTSTPALMARLAALGAHLARSHAGAAR